MTALADPVVLNGTRLRNRLVLAPITTNSAEPDGAVSDRVLRFYSERAGDVGLVIVEATAVRPDGRLVPNSLGLWNDDLVPGFARLAEEIKKRGAAAVLQLNHAGARAVPAPGGLSGASPSGVSLRADLPAFSMTPDNMKSLLEDFQAAAGRAVAAGFDGVEVHGAHFYLLSQFLSPLTNRRDDRYGGGAASRATFPLEVVRAARERLPTRGLLFFRLNGEERIEGGQALPDAIAAARTIAAAGVTALDVSLVAQASWAEGSEGRTLVAASALAKTEPAGTAVPLAAQIRNGTGLPVVAVGKLGSLAAADRALTQGADLVAIGRQLIADPKAGGKLLRNEEEQIIPCVECFQCFATIRSGVPMKCPVQERSSGA